MPALESLADSAAQKAALRRHIRKLLAARAAPGVCRRAGEELARRICQSEGFRRADAVFAYAALPREICLTPLRGEAERAGKLFALPAVTAPGVMEFRVIERGVPLEAQTAAGAFGIQEPPASRAAALPALARAGKNRPRVLLIAPGAAFAPDGRRLGRGGGFYDRFIPRLRETAEATVYGVCFGFQLLPDVPVTAEDAAVDEVFVYDVC